MAFVCQVCFEQRTERLSLPKLATGNGDVLRAEDCKHPICMQCLATFVATRVQEQRVFNLHCPFLGCTNQLYEQDIARLVDSRALESSISERFVEFRTRDYTHRAESLSQTLVGEIEADDFESIQRLWETTRLCPRCSLVIERSQGCNSFFCICGHHFDFRSAPKVVGNGISNFGAVIHSAKTLGLSIEDAEKYGCVPGKAWRRARAFAMHRLLSRIAMETRMSMMEAWDLQQHARSGDENARSRIREARGRVCPRETCTPIVVVSGEVTKACNVDTIVPDTFASLVKGLVDSAKDQPGNMTK